MAAASSEEDRFARVLSNRGWNVYRGSVLMDKAGVDLFAINGETVITIDVKSDGRIGSTGNVALECYTSYDSGRADRPGWATKASADKWVILYRNENRAVSIDVESIHPKGNSRIAELSQQFQMRPCGNDAGKQTHNLLIPVSELASAGIDHKVMEWK